jgi:hypothetical protein
VTQKLRARFGNSLNRQNPDMFEIVRKTIPASLHAALALTRRTDYISNFIANELTKSITTSLVISLPATRISAIVVEPYPVRILAAEDTHEYPLLVIQSMTFSSVSHLCLFHHYVVAVMALRIFQQFNDVRITDVTTWTA